jgi:enoyl-CoA hydratase/carnithine racemase
MSTMSVERHDRGDVRELRLARPPANALDPALVAELRAAVAAAPGEGARAIVLAGRPGMYSGGLDVPALLGLDREAMAGFLGEFLELLRSLALSEIPVVAAITGHAPAGGAVLAIHCDHRVMAAGDFRIGLNEVRVGIPLPQSLHSVLVRVVGRRQAERLGVRGLLVSAEEARAIGLVDELVAPEAVVERAVEIARDYLALPPTAMCRTRELARRDLAAIFAAEQQATWSSFVDDWFSPETQAALAALVARLKSKSA